MTEEHCTSMHNIKGLILINAFSDAQIATATRFKDEFARLGIDVDIKRNNEFLSWIKESKAFVNNYIYDFCIYYDQDIYIGRLLEKQGMRLFNNISSIEICADKMLTHIALANSGIKMPNTISGFLCYTENKHYSENQLNYIIEQLKLPLVAKLCYGSSGDSVFLIKNKQELRDFCFKYKLQPHLFQEYIQSSFGKDIRIMVVGNKVVGAMQRTNAIDFRSNIACNGIGRPFDVDVKLKSLAENVSKILNLDYCGIDLLFGTNGEPILCEVNSNAFVVGFENYTGINVAATYARYILSTIS